MKSKSAIILSISLFYLVYICLFVAKFDFNVSSTIEFSENYIDNFNAPLPPNLVIQKDSDGFDGQFYYMMATDPMSERVKGEIFRAQRILYPLAAYVLALGKIQVIPITLLLINFISIIAGTFVLIKILEKHKADLNFAYLWALNVGFLNEILRDLTSPLLFLFILCALYFWEEDKCLLSSLCLVGAVLTKELALMAIAPFILFYILNKDIKRVLIYSIPLIVFATWQILLYLKWGQLPIAFSLGIFSHFAPVDLANSLSEVNFKDSLRQIYSYFSGFPIIAFILIQCFVVFKERKRFFSLYAIALSFQLIYMLSVQTFWIGDLSRFGIGFFLFSILFAVERRLSINRWQVMLMVFACVMYVLERIVFFNVDYFITA